ncbi:MAG: tRNA (adenosine(37)-N6)-threonylcarbamoyltransferase complex ATPase subunit type 1 TsaE [Kiritimatiellia bacterium]
MQEQKIVSDSAEQTMSLASDLTVSLGGNGAVFALYGELGSGKTCFVKGIAAALGISRPVTSPTFTIINEYSGSQMLYHVDLYRLTGSEEAASAGFTDCLQETCITAVEWAERAEDLIPENAFRIFFEHSGNPGTRLITIRTPDTPAR